MKLHFFGFIRLAAIRFLFPKHKETPEDSLASYVLFVDSTLTEVQTECLEADSGLVELKEKLNSQFGACRNREVAETLVRYCLSKSDLPPSIQNLVAERLKAQA